MAIITLAEVKTFLKITSTDSTRDAAISAYIPQVENDIVKYCNNTFVNTDVQFSGDITPTVSSGPIYSFECADGGISAEAFAAADTIMIDGTVRNDKRFTVSTVSDTNFVVPETVIAEAEVSEAVVYLVDWPEGIKLVAARMIGFLLEQINSPGLTSEHIGDYSYTRDAGAGAMGYPAEILQGLEGRGWKLAKTGFGSVRDHYTENRGSWVGSRY